MAKQKQSVRRRTTIGLLTGYIRESGYQASGWRGVAQAAAEHDANLICFVGGGLNMESSYSPGRNLAFQLANAQNTDGLVIMGGAVGEFIGPKALFRFCQRYAPLPIVSVAMSLPGIPSLLVDNVGAMRQALVHLIEVHGRRRLAFVRGPQTNPEAEERYLAYQNTLAAYGLPFDPNLVAPGDFTLASGVAAVRLFLDERRVPLDAIVAANDDTALGVLSALQQRGLRVPEEVSVVGFDDVPEAAFTLPPLTTVRQPLYEQGKVATEILFARLAGVSATEMTTLPAQLVIRRSCGCTPYPPSVPGEKGGDPSRPSSSILAALNEAAGDLAPSFPANWAADLLHSAITAIKNNQDEVFLRYWDDLLHDVVLRRGIGDLAPWTRILTWLHSSLSLSFPEATARSNLWFQAQAMVTEAVHWWHGNRRMQTERAGFEFTTTFSEPLLTAFDLGTLTEVITAALPRLHFQDCYLVLYEQPLEGRGKRPPQRSYLALAYQQGQRQPALEGKPFPTRQLLPAEAFSPERRVDLLLEPLHFCGERHFGYILFGPLASAAGLLREALTHQISTALQGAFLSRQRQEAEAQLHFERNLFRSLLNHSPDFIWFMDRQGRYVAASDSYARYLGATSESIVGKTLFDFHPAEIAHRWLAEEQRLLNGETPMISQEERLASPLSGIELWASITRIPRYDENGQIVGTLGIARDISDLKRVQEALKGYSERLEAMVEERTQALRQALQKAQEADRLKSEFIANINHELRTPLTNLLLYFQTMYDQPARRTQKNLEIMGRELQRLRRLIEDLLNLSHLDSGQIVLHFQPHDINHLLENILHDRLSLAQERGLTVDVYLEADLPPVWIDEFMMTQAISNLLINAFNYTPSGGTITIRTYREHEQEQAGVAIRVQDNGPGIPADDLPHIFERFYRGRTGRESGVSGTGLGLAIVQKVVEQHHGTVTVANGPTGQGAIFTIWLPLTPHPSNP